MADETTPTGQLEAIISNIGKYVETSIELMRTCLRPVAANASVTESLMSSHQTITNMANCLSDALSILWTEATAADDEIHAAREALMYHITAHGSSDELRRAELILQKLANSLPNAQASAGYVAERWMRLQDGVQNIDDEDDDIDGSDPEDGEEVWTP